MALSTKIRVRGLAAIMLAAGVALAAPANAAYFARLSGHMVIGTDGGGVFFDPPHKFTPADAFLAVFELDPAAGISYLGGKGRAGGDVLGAPDMPVLSALLTIGGHTSALDRSFLTTFGFDGDFTVQVQGFGKLSTFHFTPSGPAFDHIGVLGTFAGAGAASINLGGFPETAGGAVLDKLVLDDGSVAPPGCGGARACGGGGGGDGGSSVPEPAGWAIMLAGFGGLGAMLRNVRRRAAAAV